jgi:putative transposase
MIVIWDRGTMHRGRPMRTLLARHPQLSVEWLPPYAPDLNPVEGLWSYEKYDRRANFVPETLDQLSRVVEEDLATIEQQPELLRSFFEGTRLPPPDILEPEDQ